MSGRARCRTLRLLGLLFVCVASSPASATDRLAVTTDRLHLVVALSGADPIEWQACHPSCREGAGPSRSAVRFTGEEDPPQGRLVLRGPTSEVDIGRLQFTGEMTTSARAGILTLSSDLPADGVRIVKSFEVDEHGDEVVMTVRLLGQTAAAFAAGRRLELELTAGRGLRPAPSAGFSAALDGVQTIAVVDGRVRRLADANWSATPLGAHDWVGFRNRFWTILARPDGAITVDPGPDATSTLVLAGEPGALTARYTFYSGPVEYSSLDQADPQLRRLLFSGLWSWLRALSLELLFLLRGLTALIGHAGPAIVALALVVKILMLPLTTLAGRLQEDVNSAQARLRPRIQAIKANHRGEEQVRRIVELYREEGVHPLYASKSLLAVLIQLPVFIAVFDMLAEDFDLLHVPFLWIGDLSRPDALLELPVGLPFFGQHLNVLPLIMCGVSVIASLRFESPGLPAPLVRRERRNLVLMALLFLVLFYTFPAGMVLYWTSMNALQLATRELRRFRGGARSRG